MYGMNRNLYWFEREPKVTSLDSAELALSYLRLMSNTYDYGFLSCYLT